MQPGIVAVMHVDTKADQDGYTVDLTVRRLLPGQVPISRPLAADVPPDVRAALRAWLDAADTIPLERLRS